MFAERFFVEGLAHASYLFGRDGEAGVVDPKRDVDEYVRAADQRGAKVVAIFETHPHADFVSGHVELAARTAAPIYVSDRYPAQFPHRKLSHGDTVAIGGMNVAGLETPGHSPDSMSFYVEADEQRVLFTGDALFVGDVGRPDLRDMHADPREMASALYDTLHEVFWKLPDDTIVYPAHGAGSLCGRKLGSAPSSTIGAEKTGNWANQFATREAFVAAMVSNLPDRPLFFYHCPFVNLAGPRLLKDVRPPRMLQPAELIHDHAGAVVVDTRTAAEYGIQHLAGSLNVGLALPVFSTWVGTFLRPEDPVVLVLDTPDDAEKAWLDLARIGYENLQGFVQPEMDEWMAAGLEITETPQLDVCCVDQWMKEGRGLLDVRTPGEWHAGGVPGAQWIPLFELPGRLAEVPLGPLAVMCGSGYRSSIACGLLEHAGRRDVVNIRGGWAAYSERTCSEPDAQELFCQEWFERMPVAV
jgi:hydroxyacylglutathione hydrolase